MRHLGWLTRRIGSGFVLVVAMAVGVAGQSGQASPKPQKKFLTGPLVIEDQGSFFIGGVPKVTDYTTLPPAPRTARDSAERPDSTRSARRYTRPSPMSWSR